VFTTPSARRSGGGAGGDYWDAIRPVELRATVEQQAGRLADAVLPEFLGGDPASLSHREKE
jgi:hypothetical protein